MPESPSRRMPLVEQELLTLHNTWVTITTNATSGAGTTYPSRIPELPSRWMPLAEQELLTLPEYLSHHHDECHKWSRNYFPFQNTWVTITTNATSAAGIAYPSAIPEPPSRRMPLEEQELHTLPEYPSHHHDECQEWNKDCWTFQNTLVIITTNATSGVGTTHPSIMHESPSRRMPLVEQELPTLPKYTSHHHDECH
jgi:hypothetical protein